MKEICNFLFQIYCDLLEIIRYIPSGLFIGGVVLAIFIIYNRSPLPSSRIWLTAMLSMYFAVMLNVAFFSREPGSRTAIDLMPFATWGTTAESRAYVIENILMFIPMGWLLPKVIGKLKKWHLCVAAGFVFSIGLELAQLMTGRGYCQTDDVIMNTLGTGIGWLLSYKYNTKGK